jgi:uncharacterized membrane protein
MVSASSETSARDLRFFFSVIGSIISSCNGSSFGSSFGSAFGSAFGSIFFASYTVIVMFLIFSSPHFAQYTFLISFTYNTVSPFSTFAAHSWHFDGNFE